jgi:hypothetical protein
MWVYQQTTGELLLDGEYVATGYSGHNEGLNNPALEAVQNVGPIPAGNWTIGEPHNSEHRGPVCLPLRPAGHAAHGRTAFLIHGDNQKGDKSASHGCIILPRKIRERIIASRDPELLVIL